MKEKISMSGGDCLVVLFVTVLSLFFVAVIDYLFVRYGGTDLIAILMGNCIYFAWTSAYSSVKIHSLRETIKNNELCEGGEA